jgi:protein-disulfide isomerase
LRHPEDVQRNRLLLLAGAALAAVIVVVVLIVALGSGSGSTSATTVSSPPTGSSLAGIPQHGDTLGKPSATALVVYEDPQCPFCREWNVGTLPSVLTQYVRTGRIKLVYHGIEVIGPNSVKGLRAIYAAGQQNRLWNMVDALYARQGDENSGWITDAVIRSAAKDAGADPDAILKASSSAAVTAQLQQSAREANQASVQGTPTFVVQRPLAAPQQLQLSGLDFGAFSSALDAVLS